MPVHWGRNAVFGNLILTISLILVILFIVLVLLGLLFFFMLQHRRRLAKAQEAQYMQAQFRNMDTACLASRAPPTGRQMPKIPPDEMDVITSNDYEPPRYEMNFLPATRHQAPHTDDKEMIYETILEEDDEDRLMRQMQCMRKGSSANPLIQSNRLDIPEYLEIRPSTPERKYANYYAHQ